MESPRVTDPAVLDRLSFVLASGQREKVLSAVAAGPKAPAQIARETELRMPHVSRALSQLSKAGLVETRTKDRRARLYFVTEAGRSVLQELADQRGDRLVAPMIRGTHYRMYHRWMARNFGKDRADALFAEMRLVPSQIDPDGWYPLRTALRILERMERLFGDGSYSTLRRMFREEVGSFGSIRRLASYLLPFGVVLEMGPSAYSREFNHGRLEVESEDHRALMKHFDWVSTPARCAGWQGVYEGLLLMKGMEGTVRKVACRRSGDPYCGYLIEWS